MVQCDLCGKEFKNTQGLKGHKTFVHGITGSGKAPSTPLATEQRLSSLEELLELTGQDTEQPVSMILCELDGRLGLTEQQTESLTEQLKSTTDKVTELARQQGEFSRLTEEKLSELRGLSYEAAKTIVEDMYLLILAIDGHKHHRETGAVTFMVKPDIAERIRIALEQARRAEVVALVAEMFKKPAKYSRGKG